MGTPLFKQVTFTAAVGMASTHKEVMDLWWNTAFLAPEGERGQEVAGVVPSKRVLDWYGSWLTGRFCL